MLTWNEESNISACLGALAQQSTRGFDVIVVDAGSSDRTVSIIETMRPTLPFALRLHLGPPRMPIGEARNLGVQMATASRVAFVSADAEPEPDWAQQALATLQTADMAFGLQIHAPQRWTLGAAVRGLRYQFPASHTADPMRFASNVAAAYSKELLQQFPFDPWANAAEDLLLARRANAAGYVAAYNPLMVVRHRDVSSLRQEMRKNWREGQGCGLYSGELGVQWPVLVWLGLFGLSFAAMFASLGFGLMMLGATLWLPALRRGVRRRRAMPLRHLCAGMAASPLFDLAFLVQYLRGLAGARRQARTSNSSETPT